MQRIQRRSIRELLRTFLVAVVFVLIASITEPGFTLTIQPQRSPGDLDQTKSAWVLDIVSSESPKTDWERVKLGDGWIKKKDASLPSGAAALTDGKYAGPLTYTVDDNSVEIAFASGPQFGVIRVASAWKAQLVDLSAPAQGLRKYRFERPFFYNITTWNLRHIARLGLYTLLLWFGLFGIVLIVTRPSTIGKARPRWRRATSVSSPSGGNGVVAAQHGAHKQRVVPIAAPGTSDAHSVVISVRDVGKMYRIYDRPQDRLKQMLWRGKRQYGHEFWALRGVSFEVRRGETVGIIGRNGSGKSTLLQIIAGTLAPTEGQVQVSGRVAALLELGSGFNPEFTGRENVFLNGAILGFSREQMEARFDEIAAFADIGDFIDQPVKVYSSGMHARLAFAIGIHLEPQIFIIDEALSVGDIFFQSRCVRKLDEFRDNGGTVLFVTHDTYTVERICNWGMVLHKGVKRFEGSTIDAVNTYYMIERGLSGGMDTVNSPDRVLTSAEVTLRREHVTTNGAAYIETVRIYDDQRRPTTTFRVGEWMSLEMEVRFDRSVDGFDYGFGLQDRTGILLGGAHTYHQRETHGPVGAGERLCLKARIQLTVAPNEYILLAGVSRNRTPQDWDDLYVLWEACVITIVGRPPFWGQAYLAHSLSLVSESRD